MQLVNNNLAISLSTKDTPNTNIPDHDYGCRDVVLQKNHVDATLKSRATLLAKQSPRICATSSIYQWMSLSYWLGIDDVLDQSSMDEILQEAFESVERIQID